MSRLQLERDLLYYLPKRKKYEIIRWPQKAKGTKTLSQEKSQLVSGWTEDIFLERCIKGSLPNQIQVLKNQEQKHLPKTKSSFVSQ